MVDDQLFKLCPLDGRYHSKISDLIPFFSEDALIRYRIKIEVQYLLALEKIGITKKINPSLKKQLCSLDQQKDAPNQVKIFENQTHHDVKAVEYFIADFLKPLDAKLIPFIHFGLTSEDVNNLAYRLMIKDGLNLVIKPAIHELLKKLADLSLKHKQLVILARTHGQPALPTTLGKEIAVFLNRILEQLELLEKTNLAGKCNGAVGGYHALNFVLPKINWIKFSTEFVESLGLKHRITTTQSNYPEDILRVFSVFLMINAILIDFSQDFWRYISDDWLVQKGKDGYVGSSTMPQKINPIEFENAEGNLGLANTFFDFFSRKLPISRLQRDLSDSTVMRNIGLSFGYSLVAYKSLERGLEKLEPNYFLLNQLINNNYAILTEAWQTKARLNGQLDAYETVAKKVRGKKITKKEWQDLTSFDPQLQKLSPKRYLGYSSKEATLIAKKTFKYLKRVEIKINSDV